jgi:hypothetical protein
MLSSYFVDSSLAEVIGRSEPIVPLPCVKERNRMGLLGEYTHIGSHRAASPAMRYPPWGERDKMEAGLRWQPRKQNLLFYAETWGGLAVVVCAL